MTDPEILSSETVYRGRVFDVVHTRLRFDDGVEVEHAAVRHPGAVAIVALDERGQWLLIRQYRPAVGGELLEIPAGTLEAGEEPLDTAHRELREETGFAASRVEPIGGTWMAPGFCSEYLHYFVASGLEYAPLPGDADERLSAPVTMTFDAVVAAIEDGTIEDAKTVVATALYRSHIDRMR